MIDMIPDSDLDPDAMQHDIEMAIPLRSAMHIT